LEFWFKKFDDTKLLKISNLSKFLCCFFIEYQKNKELPKVELFNTCFQFKNYYYFCIQEVEEETGSAGEQPVSNRLPALRSNKFCLEGELAKKPGFLPFSFVTDIALMAKKTQQQFNDLPFEIFCLIFDKKPFKQPSISR